MKTLVTRLFGFIVFTLVIYVLFIIIAGSMFPLYLRKNLMHPLGIYGHLHSRMADVKVKGEVDILFLGSSHAYRGFDTRIFADYGYSTFNLGSSGQTPLQTSLLLKRYVQRLNPGLVVYEVYPETFTSDGVESSLDLLSNEKIKWDTFLMVLKVNHIKTYNTFIYALFRQLTHADSDFKEDVIIKKDTYISGGGFVERKVEHFKHHKHSSENWDLNNQQLEAFEEVVSYLHEKKIDFLLVQAPITKALYQSRLNNVHINDYFKSHGNYLNFNEPNLPLNDSLHFYDADHLNQDGVVIFNKKFIELLKVKKIPEI